MCRLRGQRNEARALLFRQSLRNAVELTVRTEPDAEGSDDAKPDLMQALAFTRRSAHALDSSLLALPSGEPTLGQMLSRARASRPDYQRWSR